MANFLTRTFNQIQNYFRERKEFNAALKELKAEIDAGHNEVIIQKFNALKDSRFMERDTYDELLERTLKIDNAPVFQALLSIQENPNYFLEYSSASGAGGTSYFSRQHILVRAILVEAENIALSLAKNPHVTIDDPGYGERTIYSRYSKPATTREDYILPIQAAKKKNMNEVYAVLAERTAQNLEKQATSIRNSVKKNKP